MKRNKFVIITAVYNAIYDGNNHIEKCLNSINEQTYKDYRVVVFDDCSTDGTWEVIKKYPFPTVRNVEHNHKGFQNILEAMKYYNYDMDKNDIYVIVDGDDYLANPYVLAYLNVIYQSDIWLTYGQFLPLSGTYIEPCHEIPDVNYVRNEQWFYTSHLKTFKKGLFDKIEDKDLRDDNGEYFKIVGDLALMLSMIEMSGKKHIKFITDVLYIYNDLHPSGLFPELYNSEVQCIRSRPKYNQIKSL
jgi:glycosyltransferase involved in cell wall biosynthesis